MFRKISVLLAGALLAVALIAPVINAQNLAVPGTTNLAGNVTIGGTLAVTGQTTVGNVSLGAGTATATAGAATLANKAGKITSEALTTAAAAAYTLTVTATGIAATDLCFGSVANGTSSAGVPVISRITPATNSLVVVVMNEHAANAFNGTIVVSYLCFKA